MKRTYAVDEIFFCGKTSSFIIDKEKTMKKIIGVLAVISALTACGSLSSATKEDLAEFSFAGQYKTFLNTKGADSIADKVIDCYRSMFDKTGISYIAANKIDPDDLAMAVVVQ